MRPQFAFASHLGSSAQCPNRRLAATGRSLESGHRNAQNQSFPLGGCYARCYWLPLISLCMCSIGDGAATFEIIIHLFIQYNPA